MDKIPCTLKGQPVQVYSVPPATENEILEQLLEREPSLDNLCNYMGLSAQTKNVARANDTPLLRGTDARVSDLANLRRQAVDQHEMHSLLLALHHLMHTVMPSHFLNLAVQRVYLSRRQNAEEWLRPPMQPSPIR